MANVSITGRCNRDCAYCFAMETLDVLALQQSFMSLETFEQTLDFLERSGMDQVRLLGGEPTIHPRFDEMVDRILERGLDLLVFSGGLIPERALRKLEQVAPESVTVLVNVLPPGHGRRSESNRQLEVYRRLGSRVLLGLNIADPGVELGFLLVLIARYDLARQVRLGLAHPILEGSNEFLHPRHYPEVGQRVADFAFAALELGVQIEFDCGWVPCMFPEGVLEELGIGADEVGLRCNPILDLLPDGRVISCYPLAPHAVEPLPEHADAAWLRARFATLQRSERQLMLYQACATCDWRLRGECTGGCLAGSLRRLRQHPFQLSSPVTESAEEAAAGVDAAPAASSPAAHGAANRRKVLPVLPAGGGRCGARDGESCSTSVVPPAGAVRPRGTASRQDEQAWAVPYVDQPLPFWEEIAADFGAVVREVYLPLPGGIVGSGRPPQPSLHLREFLDRAPLPKSVLINAITLPGPVDEVAPAVIEELRRMRGEWGIRGATVTQPQLAERVHKALPDLKLTASVLMEISEPFQAQAIEGFCDTLVPASRIVRDLPALRALRASFPGRIRLLVNEACLPGCPYRVQHFHEMAGGVSRPKSLCAELLAEKPWMRLVGSWITPQFLHFYDGLYDELKLAGRVTLQDPERYRQVLGAYVRRQPLKASEIGGGPSSVLQPIDMSAELFEHTLTCGRRCHVCDRCPKHYEAALAELKATSKTRSGGPVGTLETNEPLASAAP